MPNTKYKNTAVETQIEQSLAKYQQNLIDFVKKIRNPINIFTLRSSKNYVEETEVFLLELFNAPENEKAISRTIVRTIKDRDDSKDIETKRREAIKKAYEVVKVL